MRQLSHNLDALLWVGYWKNETSGVLRPAVEAYLAGSDLTAEQIGALRAYLRQWVNCPLFEGVDGLRDGIASLTNRKQIERWLERAEELGIDPL